MRSWLVLFLAAALWSSPASVAVGQSPTPDLSEFAWRSIGPAVMGGRIDDVAVVESDPATAYVATASAGLWKTTNHGTTFRAVFDDQPCQSIGAVAVCQSNPNLVWAGTGEANNRQSSSWGCGVFKSTDGGATWSHMGLSDTLHIARIALHPKQPDTVFVAAVGHLWGPNEERGLYRSTNGGTTWERVLAAGPDTGCTDVVVDPLRPEVIYAAMYQRRRAAWGFVGGGPGSGLFRSSDGGATWTRLTDGLPKGDMGRIGIDVYRKDPSIVYAIVEARDGGVFRSADRGVTWTRMSSTNPRPMYFSLVRVDPNDDQRIWVGGVSLMRSLDGGKTFGTEPRARLHADMHAIWINPSNSNHMLVGCDGGIQWSHDRGQTWDHYNTIPLAQFYAVAYDFRQPYFVAGGLQDNGSWIGPSTKLTGTGPENGDWQNIGGGDGFYCAIDPSDPNTVYSESQNGALRRVHLRTGDSRSLTPRPPGSEPRYRWDWCTPFMVSPHNPRKLLLGGNRLFVSKDRGDTWRRTEDLSTNPSLADKVLMGVKRGSAYPFPDIGSDFGQIVTLTESPVREGVIYVGTDDGNLQVSVDDGRTWRNVAPNVPGLPPGTYVSRVHASPHAAGRVYAAFDGHRSDDYRPYAYVSEDFGVTWRRIGAGIPAGSTVNVIRDHPRTQDLLFAGTERGLYVSFDRGGTWRIWGRPLAPLRVDDVHVHPRDNDLIVATHARGIYILDDISPLEAHASAFAGRMALLPPRVTPMYRTSFGMRSGNGNRVFESRPAPTGAAIHFWLASEPKTDERVIVTIERPNGEVVRTRSVFAATAGLNRVTWDFREDAPGAQPVAGRPVRSAAAPTATSSSGTAQTRRQTSSRRTAGGGGSMQSGPRVLPGRYIVRLRLGAEDTTQMLIVADDPRITLSMSDKRRKYRLARKLAALVADLGDADRRLQAMSTAVATASASDPVKTAPAEAGTALAEVGKVARSLRLKLQGRPETEGAQPPAESEETLGPGGQVVRIPTRTTSTLASVLQRHYAVLEGMPEMPSRDLWREMEDAARTAERAMAEFKRLSGGALTRAQGLLAKHKLPPLTIAVPSEPEAVEADETR